MYPKLRLAHIAACLVDSVAMGVDPEKAFALFDTNSDGGLGQRLPQRGASSSVSRPRRAAASPLVSAGFVERPEFISAMEGMYSDLRSLKASLNGHQSVSTAMQSVLDVLFWLILGVAVLWIYDVPVVQVYVPLGTLIVSSSFALGSSLSNIVSSLVFVLVTRPYECSDRVTASGIFNGEETLIVKKIDVLTTTFMRINNKEVRGAGPDARDASSRARVPSGPDARSFPSSWRVCPPSAAAPLPPPYLRVTSAIAAVPTSGACAPPALAAHSPQSPAPPNEH